MAISRERKEELIADYAEQLRLSKGFVLAEYSGLTHKKLEVIRRNLRPMGGVTRVVKNRLLLRALQDAGMSVPDEWLTGPVLVDFIHDEIPPVVKAMADAAREHEEFQIKGGFLGGAVLNAAQVRTVADLPPREVLLAQVMGTINAPASRVTGVIASGIRQVLYALQAYVDKLEKAGAGAEGSAQPAEAASAA